VPIIGGSGGGGYNTGYPGGGAIVIASSGSLTLTGQIVANGQSFFNFSAAGSGGAIRLVANSVTVSGSLQALSGFGDPASSGLIRIEGPSGQVSYTGSSRPAVVLSTINGSILPAAIPSLTIVSVGGYPVPAYSGQRLDTVDLILPMQLPDPISVVVAASNIPVGTQIGINFGTANAATVIPGTLSGSLLSSSTSLQLSGLNRSQLAYLFVYANFTVPQSADAFNPSGGDHVA
jgi:hypothetical protein